MGRFKTFKAPVDPGDMPLVEAHGLSYKCNGCGDTNIPDGLWIFEKIVNGKVVGMKMKFGPDGQEVHRCGEVDD